MNLPENIQERIWRMYFSNVVLEELRQRIKVVRRMSTLSWILCIKVGTKFIYDVEKRFYSQGFRGTINYKAL